MSEKQQPTVVCLCGSTRFKAEYERANCEETLAGRIVLSVGSFPYTDNGVSPEEQWGTDTKLRLDILHLRKIDLADEVLILNVGGYVGESTRREIAYAESTGKRIRWLEAIEVRL